MANAADLPKHAAPMPARPSSLPVWAIGLGAISLGLAVVGLVLVVLTKQEAGEHRLFAQEKIQTAEKSLAEVRASQDEVRQALEKQIRAGEGRLAEAEKRLQELQEKGEVVSRELEVIASLKRDQERLAGKVEQAATETRRKLAEHEEGLADLKKKAIFPTLAPIGAQQVAPRPAPPAGIRIQAGLLDAREKTFFRPAGMKVYLVREPLQKIARGYGIAGSIHDLTDLWIRKLKYPGTMGTGERLENSIQKTALMSCILGADGSGQTPEAPAPGAYWLIGATPVGNGFVFEKEIQVKTGQEQYVLNGEDRPRID